MIEKGTDYIELAAALMTIGEGLYKLGKWLEERKTEKELKEKSEKKPYQVYMTAGANKFLRIYYGKVKECLTAQLNLLLNN